MLFLSLHKRVVSFACLALLVPLITSCSVSQNNSDLVHLRTLKDQAYSGDPVSQYQLGIHYTTSEKWRWDKARGYGWFFKAAEAGHADAQYMTGMSLLLGQGVSQDEKAAEVWLALAAEQGHRRSQYQLGLHCLGGKESDSIWGRYWLEQSAWADYSEAQFLLAALFKKGLGGQKNLSEAWAWLKRAVQNKNKDADTALKKITPTLTQTETQRGIKLLKVAEKKGPKGLYLKPQIRYLQTMLNRMGFAAGPEDGESGQQTQKAIRLYLQKKELPRDTSIDQLIGYLRGKS